MTEKIQLATVILVVVLAVVGLVRSVRRGRKGDSGCCGCPLTESCKKKESGKDCQSSQ